MTEATTDSVGTSRHRPAWVAAIIVAVAVGFLYLAFRKVNWRELRDAILQARLWILALFVVITSANCLLRSLRWRVLLTAEKSIPPATVFWANMVGYLGNNYLPARAGNWSVRSPSAREAGLALASRWLPR